jgi:hypothetical protein
LDSEGQIIKNPNNKKPTGLMQRSGRPLKSPRLAMRGKNRTRRDDAIRLTNKKPRRISPAGLAVCDGGLSDFFFLPLADLAASYSPAA